MNKNETDEIIYSNLGTKYGTNRCCQEVVSFNMCDCVELGVSCDPPSQTFNLSAFGLSSDWLYIGFYSYVSDSYTATRCAHSDDTFNCVSSAPTLTPMMSDCGGQVIGEARRVDEYRQDNGNCDSYNFCPDGKCKNIQGQCV